MSTESQDQPQSLGALDEDDTPPPILCFPEGYTRSESWQRAQCEHDKGGAIGTFGIEPIVWLDNGDPHRVTFVVSGECLRARAEPRGRVLATTRSRTWEPSVRHTRRSS